MILSMINMVRKNSMLERKVIANNETLNYYWYKTKYIT